MQTRGAVALHCPISRYDTIIRSRDHSVHCRADSHVLVLHFDNNWADHQETDVTTRLQSRLHTNSLTWLDSTGTGVDCARPEEVAKRWS